MKEDVSPRFCIPQINQWVLETTEDYNRTILIEKEDKQNI